MRKLSDKEWRDIVRSLKTKVERCPLPIEMLAEAEKRIIGGMYGKRASKNLVNGMERVRGFIRRSKSYRTEFYNEHEYRELRYLHYPYVYY